MIDRRNMLLASVGAMLGTQVKAEEPEETNYAIIKNEDETLKIKLIDFKFCNNNCNLTTEDIDFRYSKINNDKFRRIFFGLKDKPISYYAKWLNTTVEVKEASHISLSSKFKDGKFTSLIIGFPIYE
jgi:hypothetical protein